MIGTSCFTIKTDWQHYYYFVDQLSRLCLCILIILYRLQLKVAAILVKTLFPLLITFTIFRLKTKKENKWIFISRYTWKFERSKLETKWWTQARGIHVSYLNLCFLHLGTQTFERRKADSTCYSWHNSFERTKGYSNNICTATSACTIKKLWYSGKAY